MKIIFDQYLFGYANAQDLAFNVFFEAFVPISTRFQKGFFPRPHLVPKNHSQNIAKIGPFGDDF